MKAKNEHYIFIYNSKAENYMNYNICQYLLMILAFGRLTTTCRMPFSF